jgi:hypothetical protein
VIRVFKYLAVLLLPLLVQHSTVLPVSLSPFSINWFSMTNCVTYIVGLDGASILASIANITIDSCRFQSRTQRNGGALFALNSNIEIHHTSFIDCGAANGAISMVLTTSQSLVVTICLTYVMPCDAIATWSTCDNIKHIHQL